MTLQIPELRAHEPTVVRRCVRVGTVELPALVAECLSDAGRPVFVWSDSKEDVHIYAAGSVIALEASGSDTLAELRARSCAVVVRLEGAEGPECLPLWVGSIACLPGGSATGRDSAGAYSQAWAGWPGGRLWVPETVIVQRGSDIWLVTTKLASGPAPQPEGVAEPNPEGRALRVASELGVRRPQEHAAGRYQRQVAEAVYDIVNSQGEPSGLSKVVIARSSVMTRRAQGGGARRRQPELHRLLEAAREQQPTATHTIVNWPGVGACISATPERLVAVEGMNVRTEALAGTAKLGDDEGVNAQAARALLQSSKDRAEHAWVASHLRSILGPICSSLSVPAAPGIRRLSSLLHLHTPVVGRLDRPRHILELVQMLHPTPAIVGSPPAAAARWLARSEQMERGHYAGPVGWFDGAGDGEFAIALRCALVRDDAVHVFAGAGVVDGSDPAMEWAETEAKLASARRFVSAAGVVQ